MTKGKIIGIVIAVLAIGGILIYWFTRKGSEEQSPLSNCDPNKCDPDPAKKGLDMCGNFSVPCAGSGANSAFTCDPNNLGYDIHGNFNVLCAGGTPKTPCDANKCAVDINGKNTGYDECGNFSVACAGGGRIDEKTFLINRIATKYGITTEFIMQLNQMPIDDLKIVLFGNQNKKCANPCGGSAPFKGLCLSKCPN